LFISVPIGTGGHRCNAAAAWFYDEAIKAGRIKYDAKKAAACLRALRIELVVAP
jgi:hypothetical protein